MPLSLTTIILTFNNERTIARVISAAQKLGGRVLVVDSFSSDSTLEQVRGLHVELVQHPFENYAKQRNWAQEYAGLGPDDWVLHLDADEVLSPRLIGEITQALSTPGHTEGFLIRKRLYFLGRPIRFGHLNPSWHLRLFQAGHGKCEDRNYDQHFVCTGSTVRLPGILHDLQAADLEAWTTSHNRWSSAEAHEVTGTCDQLSQDHNDRLAADLSSPDPRQQKRWLKNNVYYSLPPFLRAFGLFLYSYFLRGGFLDGRAGFIYAVLQAFWFRFLVDAKVYESRTISHRPR